MACWDPLCTTEPLYGLTFHGYLKIVVIISAVAVVLGGIVHSYKPGCRHVGSGSILRWAALPMGRISSQL